MAENRDKASDQMKIWKENRSSQRPDTLTTGGGNPIGDKLNQMTAGPRGPLLVQDVVFTDEMSHFDRERIPERVVHAKGGGAFGYLEVTHDISRYCKAKMFEHVGKTTPIAIRFSTVGDFSWSPGREQPPGVTPALVMPTAAPVLPGGLDEDEEGMEDMEEDIQATVARLSEAFTALRSVLTPLFFRGFFAFMTWWVAACQVISSLFGIYFHQYLMQN